MTSPAINTHGLTIDVGKHAGELYTRLPVSYLRWMVAVKHAHGAIAQAELDRRGTVNPTLDVSSHAIDRLSLEALWIWQVDAREGEGISAWLQRIAALALHVKPYRPGRHVWGPLVLCFTQDTVWPVLKTVIYKPRQAGVPKASDPQHPGHQAHHPKDQTHG